MGSSDCAFHGIIEGSTVRVTLGYNDGQIICSDEGIIIGFTDGEALGSTLGLDDGVALCLQE